MTQIEENKVGLGYWVQLGAAFLGFALSIYLMLQHTRLETGIQDTTSFCSMGESADCDVVNASPYSKWFGIPIASFGGIFFWWLFILGAFLGPKGNHFRFAQKVICLSAFVAVFVDLYLLGIQAFVLHTFCILCIATYLLNFIVLFTSSTFVGANGKFGEGLFESFRWNTPAPTGKPFWSLLLTVGLGVAGFVYYPVYTQSNSKAQQFLENIEEYHQLWLKKSEQTLVIEEKDATFGNKAALIQIVEFSDYQCPFCQKAAFVMHALKKTMRDDVFLVFKNYPLDSSCNPSMNYQLHPMACRLAQLGACANQQGRFWDFHDIVFFDLKRDHSFPTWETVTESLQPVFSREEITSCLTANESKNQVDSDLRQGKQLGITGTPAIFINGRLLDPMPLTIPILRRFVELELDRISKVSK